MRVCIVAEHASARFGGEAILPLHYFRLLRLRGIETWLVVHSRTLEELTALFPADRDRILSVPDLWIHKVIFRLSTRLPRRISEATLGLLNQLVTQLCQRAIVRRLIAEEGVNVLHQPIPVGPRYPSMLFGLGVPRVVGPLNGGMEYPWFYRSSESWTSRIILRLSRLVSDLVHTVLPGKKRADVVLVANDRTRRALPRGTRGRVINLVENGVDIDLWTPSSLTVPSGPPRFVFVGRLVDWKAVDILIRALGEVPEASLEVIGDGPMREPWMRLAHELGLSDRVLFPGWCSQRECAERLRSAVALVLPSLYECGGAVVLEAMAAGRPVIATRWGGPADYLDEGCGILVDPESYAALVDGFTRAMKRLAHSPELALSLGEAGRARAVREFDWQRKMDRVIQVYVELSGESHTPQDAEERSRVLAPGSADLRNDFSE